MDAHLRTIEAALQVSIAHRHEQFKVDGPKAKATRAMEVLQALYEMAERAIPADKIQLMLAGEGESLTAGEDGAVVLHTRRADLRARTPNQSLYLEAMATHDITFGIGPAGTGKTYLAVASAVDALERASVQRIVLTRPAVEAGERLGYLPGDLAQKVDPYLRPLYDALYDLMGFDKVTKGLRARRAGDRAAGLHARAHAEPRLRDPGRGAEHHARADEDVPDPHRLRRQGGCDRRREPDRPAQDPAQRPDRRRARAAPRQGHRHVPPDLGRRGAPSAGGAHCRRLRPARAHGRSAQDS
jgi:hypothetical protein